MPMTENEMFRKLDQYAKDIAKNLEFFKELGKLAQRENQLKQDATALEARIQGLEKRRTDKLAEIDHLEKQFAETNRLKEEELERRNNESTARRRDLDRQIAENAIKSAQLESAKKEMMKSKSYYDEQYKQYEVKVKEITEAQSRIAAALNA